MKSIFSKFTVIILLCIWLSGCEFFSYTIYCGKLKEKLFFVPQNIEKDDTLMFYNNKGDELTYIVSSKIPIKDDQFSSACDCVCDDIFILTLKEDITHFALNYRVSHGGYRYNSGSYRYSSESVPINVGLSVNNHNYSFDYFAKNDSTLNKMSVILLDSLTINKICYYNVIELQDSLQTVHVAKDFGVVQITEQNVFWTLNKWD